MRAAFTAASLIGLLTILGAEARPPRPPLEGQASHRVVNAKAVPLFRFGEGRLFTPCGIRISGRDVIVLDEKAADPGDNSFAVFDLEGHWKRELGRGGQGPGEFGQAHAFDIRDGILFVLDSFRQCVHEFAASDMRFLKSVRFGAAQVFTTPHDFCALADGGFILARPRGVRGDKALFRISPEGRTVGSFLDVVPVFESEADLMKNGNSGDPRRVRKQYAGLGYVEARGPGIVHLSWLTDELLCLDADGGILERLTLPLASLEKTVPVVKQGVFFTIERRLNYGLRCRGESIWVLSRTPEGESVLHEYASGRWLERLRTEAPLQDFDLAEGRVYALDQESGEVLVYGLSPSR